MSFRHLVNPALLTQPVYEPGKPIEDVARELGLDPAQIVKLASNENPNGPSPRALAAVQQAMAHGELYPDGGCYALRQRLARHHDLTPEQIVVGNGSNELIELLGHAFLTPGDEVVMGDPAFAVYKLVTLLFGARPIEVPLVNHTHDCAALAAAVTPRTKLLFIASPNNPTGTANTEAELRALAHALPPHVILVLDEAYAEYLEHAPDLRALIALGRPIVCLRTFSKIHGLASLRVGYGYGPAELMSWLNRVRQPFNVNALAQAAALAALDDPAYPLACAAHNRRDLAVLAAGLAALGLETVPSEANFMLVRVGDGSGVFQALQRRGFIVRPMGSYRMPDWLRITVGTPAQNTGLLAALAAVLAERT